jgi:hypothetical protein
MLAWMVFFMGIVVMFVVGMDFVAHLLEGLVV